MSTEGGCKVFVYGRVNFFWKPQIVSSAEFRKLTLISKKFEPFFVFEHPHPVSLHGVWTKRLNYSTGKVAKREEY